MRFHLATERWGRLHRLERHSDRGEMPFETDIQMSVAKTIGSKPVGLQAVQINICDQEAAATGETLGFCQHNAVFSDNRVTSEDDIGRRLAATRRGIEIR